MKLRPYQLDAVDNTLRSLMKHPCVVGPTGSGKTVIGVELARRLNTRVCWLAARRELIMQAHAHLMRATISRPGIIMAGHFPEPEQQFQVASVQTLANRDLPDVGLYVIDECHHATSSQYARIIDSGVPYIGLTATPFRLDGRPLGDIFGELIVSTTTAYLCGLGYLIEPIVYACNPPDLQSVNMNRSGTDFSMSDVDRVMQRVDLVGDIVREWLHKAEGLPTLCCAINVKHSKGIVERFRAEGIAAEHIDGSTPKAMRDEILADLKSGKVTIVSQCEVLNEGWDLPILQCLILARPTASLNIHLQQLGRVMRRATGKEFAIVLDHAGNHHRHGMATRHIEYSLEKSQKPGRRLANDFDQGLRTCENCYAMFELHMRTCPLCGHLNVTQDKYIKIAKGDLVELRETEYEYHLQFFQQLQMLQQAQRLKPGWVSFKYKDRFGKWPLTMEDDDGEAELIDWTSTDPEYRKRVYRHFVRIGIEKGYKDGFASNRYRDVFKVWPKGFVKQVRAEEFASQEQEMPF